jgi:RHS repeat-associated protein
MDTATDPTAFVPSEMVKQESLTLDAAQNRVAVATRTGAATFYDAYEVEDGASGGPSNRYTQAAGALQTHDLRGNLTYDGRFYYRYDYCNRLQEVWQVAPVDATAVGVDETFVPVQDVEALEDSRKEAYEDVNNLLHRVPREHMDPVFRGRLRKTIVGGVVRVNGSPSGGGMPRFVEPANLVLVALYGYDAWNRRVMRAVVGQGTWLSAYDGWREVAEHELDMVSFAAPATKQFVHGSRLDEVVSYRRKVGGAWEDYYLQHGGQDTAAKLLDQSGAVVEQYEYDAYGKATVYGQGAVAASATSAKGLPMLWKGIRLDPETGLLYMRNRYYSTATGRFLSGDPIGAWGDAVGSGNGYQYAGSRPGAMGDPFGLQAEPTSAIGQTFTDTLRAVDLGWKVGSLYLDGKLSLEQHR